MEFDEQPVNKSVCLVRTSAYDTSCVLTDVQM